jgi:nitrogenase-stabilizing/protective protein
MTREEFDDELSELSSAEDFLNYFGVPFDPPVVHVNRLHVLQRFHDYLQQSRESLPEAVEPRREVYRRLLARAYHDFVVSDALTEKVFRVFHETHCGGDSGNFVPVDELTVRTPGDRT